MKNTASATFKISSWEESPTGELSEGQKITHARVVKDYTGDMEGEGIVEYVMAYCSETEAEFVGIEYFDGSVQGRPGSFMFKHAGTFSGGVVSSTWQIVAGSGRGELEGLSGKVEFEAGHEAEYQIKFQYELP